jgi:hypothetical protein
MPFPLALVPAAISAGSALYGAVRGNRGPGREERRYRDLYNGAIDDLGGRARGFASRFESDLEGFDPEPMFAEATEANLEAFDDDFARSYSSRLGGMVGQGRTPSYSGFGVRDAQETIRQGQAERGRIRRQGQEGVARARMDLLGMRGNYAGGVQDRYLDAITGRYNTLESQRLADAGERRGLAGGLLGAGIQAAGAYYGARGGR